MTLKETIAADKTTFLNTDEFAESMVWTPAGGVAQPAISVLFTNTPLRGDENQDYPVEQPDTVVVGDSDDLVSVKARDTVVINSATYEVINNPYPAQADSNWSVLELRLPTRSKTKI